MNSMGTWEETGHLKFHHRGAAKFSDGQPCGVDFDNVASSGVLTLAGILNE